MHASAVDIVRVLRSIYSRNCALFEESMKLCMLLIASPDVFEILRSKHFGVTSLTFRVT